MRFLAISSFALAVLALPATSGAQRLNQDSPKGPTLQAAAVGFRSNEAKVDASTKITAAPLWRHEGQNVALMVVGVGAVIVGALVPDTAGPNIIIGRAPNGPHALYPHP